MLNVEDGIQPCRLKQIAHLVVGAGEHEDSSAMRQAHLDKDE
jgi:hypothetical protein